MLPQLDPTWYASQSFWMLITFCLMFLVVWRFVMPAMRATVDLRRSRIEEDIKKTEELKTEAARLLKELDEAQASVKQQTQAMLLAQLKVMQEYQRLLNVRYIRMKHNIGQLKWFGFGFGFVIELLGKGFAVRRASWNSGLFVVKQIPAHIGKDIIPKMQSLPQSAKDLLMANTGFIDYTDQCLIIDKGTGQADSWMPSISDVFAEDWEIAE